MARPAPGLLSRRLRSVVFVAFAAHNADRDPLAVGEGPDRGHGDVAVAVEVLVVQLDRAEARDVIPGIRIRFVRQEERRVAEPDPAELDVGVAGRVAAVVNIAAVPVRVLASGRAYGPR